LAAVARASRLESSNGLLASGVFEVDPRSSARCLDDADVDADAPDADADDEDADDEDADEYDAALGAAPGPRIDESCTCCGSDDDDDDDDGAVEHGRFYDNCIIKFENPETTNTKKSRCPKEIQDGPRGPGRSGCTQLVAGLPPLETISALTRALMIVSPPAATVRDSRVFCTCVTGEDPAACGCGITWNGRSLHGIQKKQEGERKKWRCGSVVVTG
jgi:hypothetical protein